MKLPQGTCPTSAFSRIQTCSMVLYKTF